MTLILTAAVIEAALGLRPSRRERSRDDSLVL